MHPPPRARTISDGCGRQWSRPGLRHQRRPKTAWPKRHDRRQLERVELGVARRSWGWNGMERSVFEGLTWRRELGMGPHAQLVARTRLSGEACQVNRLALEQNAIKEQVWGGVRPARGNDKGVLAVKVQSTGVRPMPRRRGWRWWGALVSA